MYFIRHHNIWFIITVFNNIQNKCINNLRIVIGDYFKGGKVLFIQSSEKDNDKIEITLEKIVKKFKGRTGEDITKKDYETLTYDRKDFAALKPTVPLFDI